MTYWPEDDETRTTGPSPFEDVFQTRARAGRSGIAMGS